MNKVIKYFFILILVVFTNCKTATEDSSTYFGGKIINPTSKYVVLFSMEKVIDTLFLDTDSKFFGKIDAVNEGMYYFKHGPENQYIYLEPQDSLMLRLNTWDFDESLVFAGEGAERNNILIDCFLEDEKDEKIFYSFNKLSPTNFKIKVDSLTTLKLKTFSDYIENHPEVTSRFKNILKIALTYPIYSRIENYPITHTVTMKLDNFPKTDEKFYDFRKSININNDSLIYYSPYSKYIRDYLYNATYSLGHKPMINEFSSDFTVDLLTTIDQEISSKETKNAFLKQTTMTHFYRKSSCDINKKAFDTYLKLSSNIDDKKIVQALLNDNETLQKDKAITPFLITDFNNTKHAIKKVLEGKDSFLLFWNPEYISKNYISSRINYLANKFPDIQFIQIKIDGNLNDRIQKLTIKNQYFIDPSSKANLFLTSKMPRSVLINKKGIITNGFASISSRNIINHLQKLDKKKNSL
jgi:hypothetical protein